MIPLVNKFHWFSWDYLWWPEAGISSGSGAAIDGYHDINDFINAHVIPSSDLITINGYAKAVLNNNKIKGTTLLQFADSLESFAKMVLGLVEDISKNDDVELSETIVDIEAMAYLGNY